MLSSLSKLVQQTVDIAGANIERRVRGEIAAQIDLMGGGFQLGQAREQLHTRARLITGGGNKMHAKPVRFGLQILRIRTLKELHANPAKPTREDPANRCHSRHSRDGRSADNPVHRMTADDVAHLMAKYESDLVRIVPAEFHQRLRHKNESSRQSERIGLGAFYNLKVESARLLDSASRQAATDFVQQASSLLVPVGTQLLPYFARKVLADLIFDLESVVLAAGY